MSPSPQRKPSAQASALLARRAPLLLLLITLLSFGRVIRCDFLEWDDPSTLARNPDFNPPSPAKVAAYWHRQHMGLYIPVTYTVWGALAALAQGDIPNGVGSQLKPAIFHTANLVLHALSALVVYQILHLLIRRSQPDLDPTADTTAAVAATTAPDDPSPTWPALAALAGALLFALHPVQVEPVAWASGLKDVLCGLLTLTALWQYLRWADCEPARDPDHRAAWLRAIIATVCFLAAMLAKPTASMAPLIALALDACILRRRPLRRAALLPAIWLILALPIMLIAAHSQNPGVITPVKSWLRPFVAADALAFYFRRVLIPANFIFDYGRRPAVVLAQAQTYFIWLIPAAAAAAVWFNRHRFPWLLAAAVAFCAPLLPVLGLRPFMMQYTSTVTDHYLYLPMLGVAIAFAFFIAARRRRPGGNRALPAACAVLFASLALFCCIQAGYWQDDETLCRHALAVNPDSFPAHLNLGHVYEMRGQFTAELHEFAEAVRANPDFALSRGNYATMLATLGHLPEAEIQCRELLRLARPLPPRGQQAFVATYAFIGRQLLHAGHPDRAIPFLSETLRLQPTHDEATAALAEARARLANLSDAH